MGPLKITLLNKEVYMTNALTIFNQLRPHSIGYDSIFDHFSDMLETSPTLHVTIHLTIL